MHKVNWSVVILNKQHERDSFDCGELALNNYLKQYASQHAKNNVSRTFVAEANNARQVLGYYTLSAGSLTFDNMPSRIQKKLPKYPIPVVRVGRLAVDKQAQRSGLGEYLLMDALRRCVMVTNEIGIVGVVVDAKHEKAKSFYLKYGFCELMNAPLTLFLPIQDILEIT